MFDPNNQHLQAPPSEPQILPNQQRNQDLSSSNAGDKSSISDFNFCYNSNSVSKGQDTNLETVNNDKIPYRFDVTQPFAYNYALVNQMSLAAAASNVSFKCDICNLSFSHISLLNHHKRIHSDNGENEVELFTCNICNTSFNQACDLKTHTESAHVPEPNKACSSCDVDSDRGLGSKKKNFITKVGGEDSDDHNSDASQEHNSPMEDRQRVHQKGHFPVKRRKLATITKCEKCKGTGIIFVGAVRSEVVKPFHCNICNGTFSRYSSLWSHRKLHSGEKPFKCDYCGVAFARAAYLKNHNRIHTGERPYKCTVCGMQFSQAPHLKSHERIHSGERPYECDICNKTFARHSTLWNHRRIHTGEKPYECEICGTSFNQASHLKNHSKVHTGEKPYRCDMCDVNFSDRFALKRHKGIHEKYGQITHNHNNRSVVNSPADQEVMWKQAAANQGNQIANGNMFKCGGELSSHTFPSCSQPSDK